MQDEAIKTFKGVNKTYSMVFFALILLLLISSIYVSNLGAVLTYDAVLFTYLQAISIATTAIFLVFAYVYPQAKLKKIPPDSSLPDKMSRYRELITHRLILIGAAGLATCVFFILTADTNLMVVLAIILIFLILSRPTPFKVKADLALSEEEKKSLMR